MKRAIKIILIFALFVLACKKKSTTTPAAATPVATLNGNMTAKLNGNNWVSIQNTGELIIQQSNNSSGLVLNGQTASDLFAIGISLPTASPTLVTGSHDLGGALDDVTFSYATKTAGGGTLSQDLSDSGNVVITSVDNANKKISGTFNFKLHKVGSTASADSIKITTGVFTNINYTIVNQ
jgi:hypothetical protein